MDNFDRLQATSIIPSKFDCHVPSTLALNHQISNQKENKKKKKKKKKLQHNVIYKMLKLLSILLQKPYKLRWQ
jgi:hypothetical protein